MNDTVARMGLLSKKLTFLVVCKANITRSAYLHGYMEYYLKTHMPYARKKVRIISAGIKARQGGSAHQVIRHVARLHGFSLRNHRSEPLTKKNVKKADVILVMEQYQKDEVLERFPKAREKTFRLMEYLWTDDLKYIQDVPDPTGQNTADYEAFIEMAHTETDRIFRELGSKGTI